MLLIPLLFLFLSPAPSRAFFFPSACNCNSGCQPCNSQPACPPAQPCGPSYGGFQSYALPPAPIYGGYAAQPPAYNVYSTGYSTGYAPSWIGVPPAPQPLPYPTRQLPTLEPLPRIPDAPSYQASYGSPPYQLVPAATVPYEVNTDVIEIGPESIPSYPTMERVTVEPLPSINYGSPEPYRPPPPMPTFTPYTSPPTYSTPEPEYIPPTPTYSMSTDVSAEIGTRPPPKEATYEGDTEVEVGVRMPAMMTTTTQSPPNDSDDIWAEIGITTGPPELLEPLEVTEAVRVVDLANGPNEQFIAEFANETEVETTTASPSPYPQTEVPATAMTPMDVQEETSGYNSDNYMEQTTPSYGTEETTSSYSPYTHVYPIPPQGDFRTQRSDSDVKDDFIKGWQGLEDIGANTSKPAKDVTKSSTPRPMGETSMTCNSAMLGDVMYEVMVDDVSISKRRVAKATADNFGIERYDVFCAKGEFSYSIHARKYCEVTRDEVTCFAFR